MSISEEEKLQQETRIWCPMCGLTRLIKYYDPPTNRTGFICSNPTCRHIASVPQQHIWSDAHSPKSILVRQLTWLGDYYFQAINTHHVSCDYCGGPAHTQIC